MSINKNFLNNYLQEREDGNLKKILEKNKYSHNRMFDEPSSLKEEKHCFDKGINNTNIPIDNNIDDANNACELANNQKNKKILLENYTSLIGLQRKIVNFIYNSCKIARNKFTHPISIGYLSEQCETTKVSAKKNLQRLENKGIIIRKTYKDGRGGWTQYELNEKIFQEALHQESTSKNISNLRDNEVQDKIDVINEGNSKFNIATELPDDWLNIDISDASEFGFTLDHLYQLYRTGNCDPRLIERSLEHFLFDLKNNSKLINIKTEPISYFMGIIKRSGVYSAPNNYQTKKEIAMRAYIENEKNVQERECALEEKMIDLKFQKWLSGLGEEEKQKIIPDNLKNIQINAPKIAALRTYFKNVVFEHKEDKIIANSISMDVVEK